MSYIKLENGVITGCVDGKLPSIKNSRRIVYVGKPGFKRPISIKSEAAEDFVKRLVNAYTRALEVGTLEPQQPPLGGKLRIDATVYYDSLRQDLDIELLCDCLEDVGLIYNDRLLWEKHSKREIDKKRPRVEFTVKSA